MPVAIFRQQGEKLLANEVRPFGTLLEEMGIDGGLRISDMAGGFWPETIYHRPDIFETAIKTAEELYASDNLVRRFVVLRLWQEWRNTVEQKKNHEVRNIIDDIVDPIRLNHLRKLLTWQNMFHRGDSYSVFGPLYFHRPAYIMYRHGDPLVPYHVTDLSALSLYMHYFYTVYAKHDYFQYCKHCGKLYVAPTAKTEGFCSETCRKAQQKENRQRYDEKVREDKAERAYRNTYMYWYNRLKKLRQSHDIEPEKLAELEHEFKAFCAEGKKRKKAVQKEGRDERAFIGWLLGQQDYFDGMLEHNFDLNC